MGVVVCAGNPRAGRQKQVNPWGSLASQPSLIDDLQANKRTLYVKEGRWMAFLRMTPEREGGRVTQKEKEGRREERRERGRKGGRDLMISSLYY